MQRKVRMDAKGKCGSLFLLHIVGVDVLEKKRKKAIYMRNSGFVQDRNDGP